MMGGNPSWWWSMMLNPPPSLHQPSSSTIFSSSPPTTNPYLLGSPSYSLPLNSSLFHYNNHDLPHSWNQQLLGGLTGGDEDDHGLSGDHFQSKKLENWEEHQTFNISSPRGVVVADVKQENSQNITNLYGHGADEEFQAPNKNNNNNILPWSQQVMPVSSPRSCVISGISSSTSSNNILDFSYNNTDNGKNQLPYLSSECNNTATGSVSKKARVQTTSTQPPLKVRKEKLGERITALHQLVSPFGKTDTASVLLEVIGYIRFLQGQIEALSSPYLATASSNIRNQQSVQRHRNGVFPEDPSQDSKDKAKDLRSRGLCLVPVSCTQHVGGNTENGADYWAPPVDFDERHAWK